MTVSCAHCWVLWSVAYPSPFRRQNHHAKNPPNFHCDACHTALEVRQTDRQRDSETATDRQTEREREREREREGDRQTDRQREGARERQNAVTTLHPGSTRSHSEWSLATTKTADSEQQVHPKTAETSQKHHPKNERQCTTMRTKWLNHAAPIAPIQPNMAQYSPNMAPNLRIIADKRPLLAHVQPRINPCSHQTPPDPTRAPGDPRSNSAAR